MRIEKTFSYEYALKSATHHKFYEYVRAGILINLKYILLPGINDKIDEATKFFELCLEINARKILISRDYYTAVKGIDLTDSAIQVAHYLFEKSKACGFQAELWDTFTENDLQRLNDYRCGVPVKYNQYEKAVIDHIAEWFGAYTARKIAFYGLGTNTKIIIDNFPQLNIVCLLDPKYEGKMMFGKDVLSIEDALAIGIDTIVIAALPANVPLIFERIKDICLKNCIEAYSMNGRRLGQDEGKADEILCELAENPANKPIIETFQSSPPYINAHNGKFAVKSNYDIGYTFIAPIASKFLFWISDQARERQLDFLLFAARDSWVLIDMIKELGDYINLPPYVYFQVSRSATLLAGLTEEKQIEQSIKMTFDGPAEKLLAVRYRLSPNEIMPRGDESDKEYVMRHSEIILRGARSERENYRKYIASLGIPQNGRIGFVDFMSVGTSVWGLERVMEKTLTGLFIARRHNEDFAYMDIQGMFETECLHVSRDYIEENHYFLETIFVSPEATLTCFDKNGKPIFGDDYRSAERLQTLKDIHRGMLDYARCAKERKMRFIDADLILFDYFIHFLSPQYSKIETGYFKSESLMDEFTNRTFSLR